MKKTTSIENLDSLAYLTPENLQNAYLPIKINGKFHRQIKLGNNLISKISDLTNQIDWIKNLNCNVLYRTEKLSYKINSLISEDLKFSFLGLNDSNPSNIERNLHHCFITVNKALAAYIFDFENNMVSGDPTVWHDQLLFLSAIYLRIKNFATKYKTITNRQCAEIEQKMERAMFLFNYTIDSISWNQCFNNTIFCQTFGWSWQSFGYALETFFNLHELKKLKFEYFEEKKDLLSA